ncbi:YegP family protein [Joostella sp. CR20]|uniref:YegP family protein n=1 Tax=Joostella sp. CR20 TaxID=2804312 RepID=UPI00313A96F7
MFKIILTKNNGYILFNIENNSRKLLFTSTNFSSISEATENIENLKDLKTVLYERKTNTDGKFFFIISDKNGNVIGKSQNYSSEAGMENGINTMQQYITSAVIKK